MVQDKGVGSKGKYLDMFEPWLGKHLKCELVSGIKVREGKMIRFITCIKHDDTYEFFVDDIRER